jgi:hypothetical protein
VLPLWSPKGRPKGILRSHKGNTKVNRTRRNATVYGSGGGTLRRCPPYAGPSRR